MNVPVTFASTAAFILGAVTRHVTWPATSVALAIIIGPLLSLWTISRQMVRGTTVVAGFITSFSAITLHMPWLATVVARTYIMKRKQLKVSSDAVLHLMSNKMHQNY